MDGAMKIIIDNVPELDQVQMMAVARTLGNECYNMGLGVVQISVEQPK